MSLSRVLLYCVSGTFALAAAVLPGASHAAAYRAHYISATAMCSGPLPVYDNQLKRRPLGILNQGTTNVFISCSVPSDFEGDVTNANNIVEAHFNSFGGSGAINCTLNAGVRGNSGSEAASAVLAVDGSAYVAWAGINKMDNWGSYNFSCVLPPNVEMGLIIYQDGDTSSGL